MADAEGDAPIERPACFRPAKFSGPAEFRQALLGHREEFVETLTEKLLTYALGRGVEHYDMPAVRAICARRRPTTIAGRRSSWPSSRARRSR